MRFWLCILLGLQLVPPVVLAEEAETIAVIVPKSENLRNSSKAELALIFWRKKLYWGSGRRIEPVNLLPENALRRRFSQSILDSLPEDQVEYWNALYFHGTTPPHVVRSQEAMLRYVAETPGSIGYVDACQVDARVKAVAWLLADGSLTYSQPVLSCF
ncbi:hypothetical protein [Methylobacillus sp.]|uniref:hypothetical protein n=1 Tax=Methylobacillus sp. TaxID=56818 RepID=UPI002FE09FF5